MADEKDQKENQGTEEPKGSKKLLAEACKAFGIDPKYIFASRQDNETGEMVILTNGGKRVRYRSGQEVEPLDPIAITGINPIKRKPITGAGAGKK